MDFAYVRVHHCFSITFTFNNNIICNVMILHRVSHIWGGIMMETQCCRGDYFSILFSDSFNEAIWVKKKHSNTLNSCGSATKLTATDYRLSVGKILYCDWQAVLLNTVNETGGSPQQKEWCKNSPFQSLKIQKISKN